MRRILGVSTPGFTTADGQLVRGAATPEGREWGLPAWAIYAFPVAPEAVTTVLARDAAGRATAWVERFGEGGRGAFVRFWGRDRALPAAGTAEALAEHGL